MFVKVGTVNFMGFVPVSTTTIPVASSELSDLEREALNYVSRSVLSSKLPIETL
jgi:hypothetical protein